MYIFVCLQGASIHRIREFPTGKSTEEFIVDSCRYTPGGSVRVRVCVCVWQWLQNFPNQRIFHDTIAIAVEINFNLLLSNAVTHVSMVSKPYIILLLYSCAVGMHIADADNCHRRRAGPVTRRFYTATLCPEVIPPEKMSSIRYLLCLPTT